MSTDTELQQPYVYERDHYAYGEVRIRFHEFDDEMYVYSQLEEYKDTPGLSGHCPEPVVSCEIEDYLYSVPINTGPLSLRDEKISTRRRVAEVFHYRNAFGNYFGRDMKGKSRLLPIDDMQQLAKLGGMMATDALLNHYFENEMFIQTDVVENDPSDSLKEGEICNLSTQFLLMKNAHFNPLIDERKTHAVTKPREAELELSSLGRDMTFFQYLKKDVFTYRYENKLILLTARLFPGSGA